MKFGSDVPKRWRNMLPQSSVCTYTGKATGSFKMLVHIKLDSVTSRNTIILIFNKICRHDSYNRIEHLGIILNYLYLDNLDNNYIYMAY